MPLFKMLSFILSYIPGTESYRIRCARILFDRTWDQLVLNQDRGLQFANVDESTCYWSFSATTEKHIYREKDRFSSKEVAEYMARKKCMELKEVYPKCGPYCFYVISYRKPD